MNLKCGETDSMTQAQQSALPRAMPADEIDAEIAGAVESLDLPNPFDMFAIADTFVETDDGGAARVVHTGGAQ